jgi:hypothetical protein
MVSWGDAGRVAGKGFNVVANTIGVPLDYMAGKAEGEDDFRAGAGAVASGLGGWKGALAGAGAGSMFGPLGTAVGGIAGGIAGGFAGGWAADRADELVRGKNTGVKNNMSQAVQLDNGDVAEVDDNGNLIGWLVKGGAVVAGGDMIYNAGRELATDYGFNRAAFNSANPSGVGRFNNTAAAQQTLGTAGQTIRGGVANSRAGQFISRMGRPGQLLAAGALIDQATGGNVANAVGRGIAGGADMIANAVGIKSDLDGKNQVSQQAMKENRELQRAEQNRSTFNPDDDVIYQRGLRNNQDVEAYSNRLFERNDARNWKWAQRKDDVARRNYLTAFTADQADALLKGYMSDIPNSVNQALQTTLNARF